MPPGFHKQQRFAPATVPQERQVKTVSQHHRQAPGARDARKGGERGGLTLRCSSHHHPPCVVPVQPSMPGALPGAVPVTLDRQEGCAHLPLEPRSSVCRAGGGLCCAPCPPPACGLPAGPCTESRWTCSHAGPHWRRPQPSQRAAASGERLCTAGEGSTQGWRR